MARFSEDFNAMVKSFDYLGQGISNFLFQILLDSTLEFLDSVCISLVLDDSSFLT